jgi:two-component system, LytTR family, response regulator
MTKFNTVLIDDEKIARIRLRRLLENYGELFQITGEAKNGDEGLEMIKRLNPDVIFLDIQMPGKTGFEILKEIEAFPLIVFCTAYEEFALEAFNTLALDYLVKPVEKDRLQLTVDKLQRARGTFDKTRLDALMELINRNTETKKLHSIPHKIGDRVILIKPERITYFSANEKYVDFYTLEGEKFMTELSLKKLEERLPGNFKRVQRGIIVNSDHIKEFRKYFRGKYILVLNDVSHTKIETGRSFTEEINDFIR